MYPQAEAVLRPAAGNERSMFHVDAMFRRGGMAPGIESMHHVYRSLFRPQAEAVAVGVDACRREAVGVRAVNHPGLAGDDFAARPAALVWVGGTSATGASCRSARGACRRGVET